MIDEIYFFLELCTFLYVIYAYQKIKYLKQEIKYLEEYNKEFIDDFLKNQKCKKKVKSYEIQHAMSLN